MTGGSRSFSGQHPRAARAAEPMLVVLITMLALALRWQELIIIPRFSDESKDVWISLQIARGELLPLTGFPPYNGALFNYLVAGAFWLLGPKMEAGRVVAMLFGALVAVPTYLLGRSLGGRPVGLLAALLLATSATHVAVSSRDAFSPSLTPLFTTAGLWLLHRSVVDHSGPYLAASGLALGLALQMHPGAVALWPGLAIYLLWKGRPLKWRWLIAAIFAGLLAVWNLILFNMTTGLGSVSRAAVKSARLVDDSSFSLLGWGQRLLLLLREMSIGLAGIISDSGEVFQPHPGIYVVAAVSAVLAVLGAFLLCRRGEWLLGLALLSGLLATSIFTGNFDPVIPQARYYSQFLPLGYVGAAVSLVWLYEAAARTPRPGLARLTLAVSVVLVVLPLVFMHSYRERAYRDGRTNIPLLSALDAIARSGTVNERVYVDDAFNKGPHPDRLLDHVRLGLRLRGQQFDVIDLEAGRRRIDLSPGESRRFLLKPSSLKLAERRYRLEPVPGEPGPNAPLRVLRGFPRKPPDPLISPRACAPLPPLARPESR